MTRQFCTEEYSKLHGNGGVACKISCTSISLDSVWLVGWCVKSIHIYSLKHNTVMTF